MTDRFAGVCWFFLSVKKCQLFEINEKGRIHILNFSLVSWHFVFTLAPLRLSFSHYCICYFPAISFVIFPHCVHYFSPTLRLSFSCHCILIFPPFHLSFFCHCFRLFPAILFVIFPPLRSSVVTLPLFPPLHLSSRSSPSRLYVDHFFT